MKSADLYFLDDRLRRRQLRIFVRWVTVGDAFCGVHLRVGKECEHAARVLCGARKFIDEALDSVDGNHGS